MEHAKLDKQATLAAVRNMLLEAKKHRLYGEARRKIRMTASRTPFYHGQTNVIQRPVDHAARDHLEDERLKAVYERVMIALGYLTDHERTIIECCYLEQESISFEHLAERFFVNVRTLRWHRRKIELKLAHMLGLEIVQRSQPAS